MNCIIVDDEPLAREAMKLLIEETNDLQLIGSFNNAATASDFMEQHGVDLVFLDIQMPGITGIEFARMIFEADISHLHYCLHGICIRQLRSRRNRLSDKACRTGTFSESSG